VSFVLTPIRSPKYQFAFAFGESAPDAEGFLEGQRVVATLHDDGALGAELLGLALAPPSAEAAFTVAVEEH
jgi:hypothetical protein